MKLYEQTAGALSRMLRRREISSVELTRSVLSRLDAVEPTIQSYVTLTAQQALQTADEADKKLASGEELHPLAGIPMGIKDNICTKGTATTCASRMLEHFIPPYDAFVTKNIRENLIPVLGKLNMDEFAMGSSTETSYFKKTKNPRDLSRVPGGSSGGSAAAVAAGEAIFTLGSDTGGSIRQPASYCGVVGMKPTYGLVSRFGLIAFASSLDQIGPLTRDVTDCAMVLELIAGHDPMDSTSVNVPPVRYTDALTGDVKGLKIGLPAEYLGQGIHPQVRQAILKAAEVFESLGARVESCSLPTADYALPAYYIISSAEASSNLARFDGIKYGFRAEDYSGIDELYKRTRSEGFGKEVRRRIMLGTYALSSGYYDAYYRKAQQTRTLIRGEFDAAFEKFDLLLTPTAPNTAFRFGEKSGDPLQMYLEDLCTVSVNTAGIPAISLPCGFDGEGLPIGMQLIGPSFGEAAILRAAHAFEQAMPLEFPRKGEKSGYGI